MQLLLISKFVGARGADVTEAPIRSVSAQLHLHALLNTQSNGKVEVEANGELFRTVSVEGYTLQVGKSLDKRLDGEARGAHVGGTIQLENANGKTIRWAVRRTGDNALPYEGGSNGCVGGKHVNASWGRGCVRVSPIVARTGDQHSPNTSATSTL